MKLFISLIIVALLMLATSVSIADEVEFRTVVAKNDKSVGGDFHLDFEIRIKAGSTSPKTLSSLQADIYYGPELTNPIATNWASDLSTDGYNLTYTRDYGTYYSVVVVGGTNVIQGQGWNVTNDPDDPDDWEKVVTVEWTIATATSVNISINNTTDEASYFKTLNNSSSGSTPWTVSNQDLGDVSLPVELSSFTALADDTKVTLKWETGSEVGNLGFYVYRSETADGPFKKISELIEGAGNSAIGRTYEYIDKKVEGHKTYFYYLEDIDVQGIRDKSDAIQVTVPLPKNVNTKPLPEKNRLFQNYPNPFNPETWIPFQLANPSEVNIRIYNATGQLVKSIPLGYKQAGMYVEKSKAAYWDGRNDMGEKVSSGIYFYELRAENFSDIRKMIVLK